MDKFLISQVKGMLHEYDESFGIHNCGSWQNYYYKLKKLIESEDTRRLPFDDRNELNRFISLDKLVIQPVEM